jgi:mono/diheme cytochrome c family protein
MTFRRRWCGLRLAATAAVLAAAAPTWPQATPAPAAEEPPPKFEDAFLRSDKTLQMGKEVWDQQCRHCHGNAAYPGKAPKLVPGNYTPDFVYDRVTYGFRKMPSWKDVFTLEQRMAVAAYVKSEAFSP